MKDKDTTTKRPEDGYKPHPFAEIFPFRTGNKLKALRDDIKANGQFDEIVLLREGNVKKVLSGRSRQEAALAAGVEPIYRDFGSRPSDGENALAYAFKDFFTRDDMTTAEREIAAVKYANLKKGFNPNGSNELLDKKPVSLKEAAKALGASPAGVKRAKKIMESGTPELQEAYAAGAVKVSDAAAIADEPPEVQNQAVAAVAAGDAPTLQAAVAAINPQPAPVQTAKQIAAGLEAWLEPLTELVTSNAAMKKVAADSLKTLCALVRRL